MYTNKVILDGVAIQEGMATLNGNVLFDLTQDTVTPETLLEGITAHDKTGAPIVGTKKDSGDSSKNIQAYHGMKYSRQTSYGTTDVKLIVAKTGNYKVSWMGYKNTNGGTNGSQLYVDKAAYGQAQTTFTSTYGQSVILENVNLIEGQEIEVRARARSTTYYMYVGNLVIEEM